MRSESAQKRAVARRWFAVTIVGLVHLHRHAAIPQPLNQATLYTADNSHHAHTQLAARLYTHYFVAVTQQSAQRGRSTPAHADSMGAVQ